MLKLLKDIGIKALFAVLVVSFVLWGVPSLRSVTEQPMVKLGDKSISRIEFNEYLQNALNQAKSQNPSFTLEDAYAQGWASQLPQYLAQNLLYESIADDMGLSNSRDTTRKIIRNSPAFKDEATGEFDEAKFRNFLTYTNETAASYEAQIKKEIVKEQLNFVLNSDDIINDNFVTALLLQFGEERDVSFFSVDLDIDHATQNITEEDYKNYYNENLQNYIDEEYRKISGFVIDRTKILDEIKIDEKRIMEIFNARKAQLAEDGSYNIYQIILSNQNLADEFMTKLNDGADFVTLADEYGFSADEITFDNLKIDEILDEDARAELVNSKENDLIGPFVSPFGLNIVKVLQVNKGVEPNYEEFKEEIEIDEKNKILSETIYNLIEDINSKLDEGTPLEEIAKANNLNFQDFGYFTPVSTESKEGFTLPNVVIETASSMFQGDYSDPINDDIEQKVYFIQLDDIIDPAPIPYEEIKNTVKSEYKTKAIESYINEYKRSMSEYVVKSDFDSLYQNADFSSNVIANKDKTESETSVVVNSDDGNSDNGNLDNGSPDDVATVDENDKNLSSPTNEETTNNTLNNLKEKFGNVKKSEINILKFSFVENITDQEIATIKNQSLVVPKGQVTSILSEDEKKIYFIRVDDIKINKSDLLNSEYMNYLKTNIGAEINKELNAAMIASASERYKFKINQKGIDNIFTSLEN